MNIYVVKHTHIAEDKEADFCDNISAHISREKAEKHLREMKNEILENWKDLDTKVLDKDFSGLFHIYDEYGASSDELVINELVVKD